MSRAQKELVDIMEMVKAQKINQAKAEIMFREWKLRHEGGQACRSFREKQVTTALIRRSVLCVCELL